MESELKNKKTTESKNSKEIKILERYYQTGKSVIDLRPGDKFEGVDVGLILKHLRKKYYGILRGSKLRDEHVARLEAIGLKQGDKDYWATERIKIIILNAYSRRFGPLAQIKHDQMCNYNKRKCPVGKWTQELLEKYNHDIEELKRHGLKWAEVVEEQNEELAK